MCVSSSPLSPTFPHAWADYTPRTYSFQVSIHAILGIPALNRLLAWHVNRVLAVTMRCEVAIFSSLYNAESVMRLSTSGEKVGKSGVKCGCLCLGWRIKPAGCRCKTVTLANILLPYRNTAAIWLQSIRAVGQNGETAHLGDHAW